MSPHIVLFIVLSLGLWGLVALEPVLRRVPISLPMLYVAIGWAVFALPLGLPRLDPVALSAHAEAAEYLTEFIVIVSLMAAGLAIDRPFALKTWRQVLPLLAITMPLTIAGVALLGWGLLGLTPAAALLLGAILSPTDPVLARTVQVGPPGDDERHDVRFDLTVEAGLNDGLAFPFTHLAIAAVGVAGLGGWTVEWFVLDVVWRIAAGVAVGWAVARGGVWFVFERSNEARDSEAPDARQFRANEGIVVMATLLAAYGLAELVEGYGFLAVFVGAVTAKQFESEHEYHARTHHFVDQIEDIVLVAMLLGFGGLLAGGVLGALTVPAALVGVAVVLVVRPLTGVAALLRNRLPWSGRWAVAFLGVRGMGTLYYLAYAQNHGEFGELAELWALAAWVILVSIVVHGVSAEPLLRWTERRQGHVHPGEHGTVS